MQCFLISNWYWERKLLVAMKCWEVMSHAPSSSRFSLLFSIVCFCFACAFGRWGKDRRETNGKRKAKKLHGPKEGHVGRVVSGGQGDDMIEQNGKNSTYKNKVKLVVDDLLLDWKRFRFSVFIFNTKNITYIFYYEGKTVKYWLISCMTNDTIYI